MGKVFISYRREDAAGYARAIYEELTERFAADRIFMDVDAIEPGLPFDQVIRDAVGNVLQDGDTVTVVKDLKVKGSSSVVKVGTKVKNIRLVDGDHDIDCKIDGFGSMGLKSEFVKKV